MNLDNSNSNIYDNYEKLDIDLILKNRKDLNIFSFDFNNKNILRKILLEGDFDENNEDISHKEDIMDIESEFNNGIIKEKKVLMEKRKKNQKRNLNHVKKKNKLIK